MDRERWDDWCEKTMLGLVLVILVFGALALGGVDAWQFLTLQGLTLALLALWILRLWLSRRPQLLWPPVCWAVLAFVGYAAVRYAQSDIEYVARQELIRIIVYAFLFFVVLNNLHRQESIQVIVLTMIFLGMAISGYAIYQSVTKSDKVWNLVSTYHGRAGGTFYNPNILASFLEMLVPLGLCYVLAGRLSHVTKIFIGYAVVVMIGGVGVTLSRGGWIVTGMELVGLCVVLLFQRNYRIQALVLLAVLGTAAYLLAPKMQSARARFEDLSAPGHAEADTRMSIWLSAVRMWQDSPWLGFGPGQFDYRFSQYRTVEMQRRPGQVHNDYLNTLVDYGAVGAVLIAAAWLLLYAGVIKSWRFVRAAPDDFARKKSNKFAFMLGASLGLLGVLAHSLVDFPLHIPAIAILAAVLMALATSQWRFATERYWCRVGPWRKWAATLVLMAGVAGLGGLGWRGAMQERFLMQAKKQPVYSYAQIEKLKLASQAEPMNFETTFAIAECYRIKSQVGSAEYVALAHQAMEWYQRGIKLNPHDAYNWLGYGICLDWIGPQERGPEDSESYFARANVLDPNGYFTTVKTAVHYTTTGDWAAARTWFERSLRLEWVHNDIALNYLPIVEKRLQEAANGPFAP